MLNSQLAFTISILPVPSLKCRGSRKRLSQLHFKVWVGFTVSIRQNSAELSVQGVQLADAAPVHVSLL